MLRSISGQLVSVPQALKFSCRAVRFSLRGPSQRAKCSGVFKVKVTETRNPRGSGFDVQ